MASYLPSTERGYLPLYVLLVGVTALGNVIQCYTTLSYTQRVYAGRPSTTTTTSSSSSSKSKPSPASPATPLSARTFGTWNLAVGIARVFAAYHMTTQPSWYQMSLITNLIGLWHFGTEAFVYGTCQPKGPWLAPVTVATVGAVWHVVQWGNYVG